MSILQVGLGERSYPIIIEPGCLERIPEDLASLYPATRYCIITDDNVSGFYGERLQQAIESAGLACDLLGIPPWRRSQASAYSRLTHKPGCSKGT